MRFLMTYIPKTPEHTPEKSAAIDKLIAENVKAGILLDTGAMLGLSTGGLGKLEDGKFTLSDGPFPETKEMIVGYAIVQVRDRAEAVEQARRFMQVAGDGECEIRQLAGPSDGIP
jgi:hypothetical protein